MKITVLKLAMNDLKEIQEYLSRFGENPLRNFRTSFENFCVQVTNMPCMFQQYEQNKSYRKAIIAYGYLIFYQIDENRDIIKIYRVLHDKRNTEPLLDLKGDR